MKNKAITLAFDGVNVSKNFLTGTMHSRELVESFRKDWFPAYQRERINNKKKISELIEIFKTNAYIDSIKLNVRGDLLVEKGEAVVVGEVAVIDGQQRLMALIDSGVQNIKIPVELYMNLSLEEEIKLFHQYNRSATKLKFGELAKSTSGTYGNLIMTLLRRREYPVPRSINSSWHALSLSTLVPLLHFIHRLKHDDILLRHYMTGNKLINFLEDKSLPAAQASMTDFIVRSILQLYVDVCGAYDHKAVAWRRPVVMAFVRLIAINFLESSGKIDLGKFDGRIRSMPSKLFTNAAFREIGSGQSAIFDIELGMVEFLNWKLSRGLLDEPKRFAADVPLDELVSIND